MNKMGIETFCWFGLWKMHVACCLVLHANAAEQYCNLAAMKITEILLAISLRHSQNKKSISIGCLAKS